MSLRLVHPIPRTLSQNDSPPCQNRLKPLPPPISPDSMTLPDILQLLAIERPAACRVILLYARHAVLPVLQKLANKRIAQTAVLSFLLRRFAALYLGSWFGLF